MLRRNIYRHEKTFEPDANIPSILNYVVPPEKLGHVSSHKQPDSERVSDLLSTILRVYSKCAYEDLIALA